MAGPIRLSQFLTRLTTPQEHLTELALGMPVLGALDVDAAHFSGLRRSAGHETRVLRGRKMRTVASLFDEFAAALQFPYYFGENQDAFDDCLRDLDDTLGTAEQYVLLIFDGPHLLAGEPDELEWFTDAMAACSDYWAEQDVIFRVIFQGFRTGGVSAARLELDKRG